MPLLCICGKSGVGKTTVVIASELKEVISNTTREMRDGEVNGYDYHFRSKEWMLANRNKFNLDWKIFSGNIYGATDFDVNNLDIIVITLDSAIKLRKIGVLVYIVWLDGPIRQERTRSEDVANGPELMKEVDLRLTNDKTVEEVAEKLRVLHRSLKTIGEFFHRD